MGIEHRMKDETEHTRRCPWCGHVSTLAVHESFQTYFYCQNPNCKVQRIYPNNTVMTSNKLRDKRNGQ